MDRGDKIFSAIYGSLAILTMVIGLNVIPKDEQGYAERSIDVAFLVTLFSVLWSVPCGMLIGDAISGNKKPPKPRRAIGPSYKTKDADGLTVRDYGNSDAP